MSVDTTAQSLVIALVLLREARGDLENVEQEAIEVMSKLDAVRRYLDEVAAGVCAVGCRQLAAERHGQAPDSGGRAQAAPRADGALQDD